MQCIQEDTALSAETLAEKEAADFLRKRDEDVAKRDIDWAEFDKQDQIIMSSND